MPKPNTLVETVPAFAGANVLHPVLSDDYSRLTVISEDWCFDARNPDCYAAGVLPAVDAVMPVAGLVSLAPGNNAVLGRTMTITAVPTDAAKLPTFDGKGLVFDGAVSKSSLGIRKSGLANAHVGAPIIEGFVPFLEIVAYKPGTTSTATLNVGPYVVGQLGTSRYGGLTQGAYGFGVPIPPNTAAPNLGIHAQGVWNHYAAMYYGVDTVAHTMNARYWHMGEMLQDQIGFSSTAFESAIAQQQTSIGGGAGSWNGSVARVRRIYMNPLSAVAATALALANQIVNDDYNFCLDSGLFD